MLLGDVIARFEDEAFISETLFRSMTLHLQPLSLHWQPNTVYICR